MRLILVRHGETVANTERRYLGHSDSPLTAKGWEQARFLAEEIQKVLKEREQNESILQEEQASTGTKEPEHSLRLYSSDLGRCEATANVIGQLIGLSPILESGLRELNFGEWDGLTYEDIMSGDRSLAERWYEDPFAVSPPDGETLAELGARLDDWLGYQIGQIREIMGKPTEASASQVVENATIIVVTHGGPIRCFLSKHVQGDESRFWQVDTVPPGEFVIVENVLHQYKRT